MRRMRRCARHFLSAALSLLIAAPGWPADQESAPNTEALSLTVALTVPTSYYFRGITQSNAGFQVQPFLELKANLYEGGEKDVLTGVHVKAAGWAHMQSVAAPIATNYYEQDIYLTAGVSLFKRVTLEGGWNLYAYPGIGSAAQVQEAFGRIGFDDGGIWPFKLPADQDFSIAPYILFAGETSGGADGAAAFGGRRGVYMELGIDPGYVVGFSTDWSARFHLPLVVGMSLSDYYQVATSAGLTDKTFGFADLGLVVDVPLKVIPARYGKWTLSGGPHFLWLGSNNKVIAGPGTSGALNAVNVTGGSGFELWGFAGLKIEY